ncbi:AraC family transcriptional regulator [Ancylobacter sp. Lp-2]|uniref:helix-turn-helix domain-containing protein n=1 Tax=Ancylobacter sp. Lp-2 TaxID=2881339 RepID=UPI001E4BEA3E|nr:AraC family transcriptional regulator [Ancylobacter sp. Lp-2]MCB4770981.1 AraC family transcriptional regulator [Ancylobacter sp. Lp-2]
MIFVPLPFVVALLLVLLAIRLARTQEDGRHHRLFLALIAAYASQSVLIGLHWGYDIRAVLPFQVVLASLIAPLAFLAFRSLASAGPENGTHPTWLWAHLLLPPLVVAGLVRFLPSPVGPVVVALFLGYGAALFWLARRGPDALISSRLDGALRSYRALIFTAAALVGSALVDVVISFDLDWSGGRHTPLIIALFNMVTLLALGTAAAAADADASPPSPPAPEARATELATECPALPAPEQPDEADEASLRAADLAILARLDALMAERRLYTDVDLDLGRLARRLALPARRLSEAINRVHSMSVSHYVNGLRVAEAQRLLGETDLPVTRVMLEAGFLTKSNFNREFRRLAGMSPSEWRATRRLGSADQPL